MSFGGRKPLLLPCDETSPNLSQTIVRGLKALSIRKASIHGRDPLPDVDVMVYNVTAQEFVWVQEDELPGKLSY